MIPLATFSVGEWATVATLAFAAIAWTVRETLDTLGKSPRSRTLREENIDLIRRNEELEERVRRQDERIEAQSAKVRDQDDKIRELNSRIRELEQRDQKAVLESLAALGERQDGHHSREMERHHATLAVLKDIHNLLAIGARVTIEGSTP